MSEKFDFTAGEYVEAQEKKEQRDKGREEAKFYRRLLDVFERDIVFMITRKDFNRKLEPEGVDLNTSTLKLKELEGLDSFVLNHYMKQAIYAASLEVSNPPQNVSYNVEEFLDMTPSEFVAHIESLKSSLIKN